MLAGRNEVTSGRYGSQRQLEVGHLQSKQDNEVTRGSYGRKKAEREMLL